MIRYRLFFACVGCLTSATILATGCSSSTTHGTIRGTVTLDGKPLPEGVVRFVPADRSSQTASAAISDGEYLLTAPVGISRVEFSAPKITGKKKMYDTADSPEVDIVTELLPERYNLRSEIQIDVKTGESQHTHELTSDR